MPERLVPLADDDPLDALLDAVGDARFVLLGEASHGTDEFYAVRARLTAGDDSEPPEAWPTGL